MTDVNVTAEELLPQAGSNLKGYRLGFVDSAAKAAQNDKWIVMNASEVVWASIRVDATGAAETYTLSGKNITLTSATTGACSGVVLFRA
jgi:hypothetical protein